MENVSEIGQIVESRERSESEKRLAEMDKSYKEQIHKLK